MSDTALKSLEETMRKLETAMKSSPRKKSAKRTPPKRKPPTPRKRSHKLTAREKKEFISGTGLGSIKSLNKSIKFMEKERMEYRNTLMNIRKILEDDQDIDECLKIINTVL